MSLSLGLPDTKPECETSQKSQLSKKEVCAYSGEKCVFTGYGQVEKHSDTNIRVIEDDGTVTTIYNAVVIVKERPKKY